MRLIKNNIVDRMLKHVKINARREEGFVSLMELRRMELRLNDYNNRINWE